MLLFILFKFRKFTDSRWATVVDASRMMIVADRVGLDGVVSMARADPTSSDYYMHGYTRLGDEERRLVVVAGLSSHVPDAVLLQLLEDDRLCRVASLAIDSAEVELAWLENLPYNV